MVEILQEESADGSEDNTSPGSLLTNLCELCQVDCRLQTSVMFFNKRPSVCYGCLNVYCFDCCQKSQVCCRVGFFPTGYYAYGEKNVEQLLKTNRESSLRWLQVFFCNDCITKPYDVHISKVTDSDDGVV